MMSAQTANAIMMQQQQQQRRLQAGQFGCGILKMVGPKKQVFWPRINILKGNNF